MMKMSQSGVDLVKKWEGFRDRAYLDTGGVWTIGYGHIAGVKEGDTCTKEQAEEWLRDELQEAEQHVEQLVDVEITQYQFDALVSFIYNVGGGAFRSSTMRRLLNDGDYDGAALQFPRWCKDNGKVIQGLLLRRKDEQRMFQGLI